MIKNDHPPFFHLAYEIADENDRSLFRVTEPSNDDINCLVTGNPLSCTGCFLRKDISRKFLFNEDRNLSGSEDWELWFRVLANHSIKTDDRVSARMYQHTERSVVMEANETKLVKRKELALHYAFQDPVVKEKYASQFRKIDAFGDSYIALHLILGGKNRAGLRYLLKFVKNYFPGMFSKRFLVIMKHFVFNLFR
jgi:hypothetical protein